MGVSFGSCIHQVILQSRELLLQVPHQRLVGHHHVHSRIGCDFPGAAREQQGVPRLLDVAPRGAHRANNGGPCAASQEGLQYPRQLGISKWNMPTSPFAALLRKGKTSSISKDGKQKENQEEIVQTPFL